MKLKLRVIFLFLNSLNFTNLFSQENEIIKNLREKMIGNIKILNSLKDKILDESSDSLLSYEPLINNGLKKIFNYNSKQIMYKEDGFEELDVPISILHRNYINLTMIQKNKIFVSDLVSLKNSTYYLLGFKNITKSKILIFKLESTLDYPIPFTLINSKGEFLFSTGITPDKIKNILPKLNDPKTEDAFF